MFTGIIQEVGSVIKTISVGKGRQIDFSCREILPEIKPGDSVACNGVCLSATQKFENGFRAFAVEETISKSSFAAMERGATVNFELSLLPSSRLGGHFVTGHVEGVAPVRRVSVSPDGGRLVVFQVPEELVKYCVKKGSIAVNGVSLTIADLQGPQVTVALIPLTLEHTNLAQARVGEPLNVETDILGKYVENLMGPLMAGKQKKGISEELLVNLGYHAQQH